MHLVEESKSGGRVAEGGSWGKGVGVVAGRARHQVAGEEDVRGWMRKMMVIERNATISRHPQDQGTVVGDYENDPGIHSIKELLLIVVRMT